MEQRRFLIAMILSGLVILVWQVFLMPPVEEFPEEHAEETVIEEEEIDPDADPVDPEAVADRDAPEFDPVDEDAETEAVAEVDVPVIEERRDVLNAKNIHVQMSNRGAVVTDVQVTSPEQYSGVGGDLMRAFEEDAPAWPYSLVFTDQNIELAPDQLFEVIEEESTLAADGEGYDRLTYRHVDPRNRFVVDKVYTVDQESQYVVRLSITVENLLEDMRLVDTPALDIIGRDDPDKQTAFFDFRPDVLEGVCLTTDGTERAVFDKLEGSQTHSQYDVIWAGADTRYFLMSAAPDNGAASCIFEAAENGGDYLRTRMVYDSFSIPPGGTWTAGHMLYMGPKDFGVLRDAGNRMEEAVDYGLLTILARPLRAALAWFYGFTGNWGLAIILLTFVIKAATWRITGKAYVNAERMKQIQPLIKEIREKYEKDQQRMTEETMKAFKENNVSPLGCLPLLIQMPILYGLFVMIYNSVELYQAEFLWYADLSAPDPMFILPVVMGGVMFIQQRLTMATAATTNPQMMMVMKIMPIMFTAFMLFLPAGLVLYYLLNLLMGLAQQFLIKRRFRLAEEAGESI